MSPLPRQSAVWDDARNTSRVRPPAPNALPDAMASLGALRRNEPALVRWIEDGAPTLTEQEHIARFGAPYTQHRRRRR